MVLRFTLGTNNGGTEPGYLKYSLAMINECRLSPDDYRKPKIIKYLILRILYIFILIFCFNIYNAISQDLSIGIFEGHADIGNIEKIGSVRYIESLQEYIIEASGENMWFDHDEFHFLWRRIKGDFILRAHVEFIGDGVEDHRKLGWMIRQNLEADAPHVNASIHGDGLTSLQFRRTIGANTEELRSEMNAPNIVQLERKGSTYIMSTAHSDKEFLDVELSGIDMGDEVYIGLFVCSHNNAVTEKAIFRNVRIIIPAKGNVK